MQFYTKIRFKTFVRKVRNKNKSEKFIMDFHNVNSGLADGDASNV